MSDRAVVAPFFNVFLFRKARAPLVCLLVGLVLLFLNGGMAEAAPPKTVRVGLYQNQPLAFKNAAGEIKGVYVDLIDAVAKREKWRVQYVFDSRAGVFKRLSLGDIDLLAGSVFTPERAALADFTREPVWNFWGELLVPPASPITGLDGLNGGTVAVVDGEICGRNFITLLRASGLNGRILEFASFTEVGQAVRDGLADAGVTNSLFGRTKGAAVRLKSLPVSFSPVSTYFAVPRGRNGDLAATLDRYLREWRSDPGSVYFQSANFWLGGASGGTPMPAAALLAAGAALGLVALAALWGWKRFRRPVGSARKRGLQKGESPLSELFDRAPVGVFLCDREGRLMAANPVFTALVGLAPEAVPECRYRDFVPEALRDREVRRMAGLAEGGGAVLRAMELLRDDGRKVPVQVASLASFRDGLVWTGVVESSGLTPVEADGKQAPDPSRQKQKMDAIGTLAGGIAHDFNNILSSIFGYTEQALQEPGCDEAIRTKLKAVLVSAGRARTLIRQVLTYSRKEKDDHQPVEVGPVVADSCELLKGMVPRNVRLHLDLDAATGVMLADPKQLQQIVLNLGANAFNALEGREGEVGVSLRPVRIDPGSRVHEGLAAGDYACLRVCDDGQGVSAEIVENIFDPFFTTRSQGKGIGLGLSVVYGIVENCKGRIRVDSTPGQGSLFEVLLPLVPGTDDPCERTLPGRDEAGLRGHEHILFVDDEAMLVDLGKGLLQPFGYQVSGSVSAERAYDLFRNCPERYDLVVTDQVMPEMNGDELARKILKIRPDVPIIICTGHSSVLTEESVAEIGVRKLLRKPLASRLLLVSVRQALDSGRDPVEKQLAGDRPDDSGEKGGSYGEEAVAEAFLALPEALRDALGEAVESLNPDRIETAIDGISRRKPELGRVLAAWAYDFRFDLLKDLVDSSHSTAAEKGDTT